MSETPSRLSLEEMEQQLHQPGALPADFSLSVGIIASYPPKDVAAATRQAVHNFGVRFPEPTTEPEVLQSSLWLARDVDMQRNKLGKRGRLGVVLASIALGSAISAGVILSHDVPAPASQQTSHERISQNNQGTENEAETAAIVLSPFMGLFGGLVLGEHLNDRLARSRARRLVKKAQRAQN